MRFKSRTRVTIALTTRHLNGERSSLVVLRGRGVSDHGEFRAFAHEAAGSLPEPRGAGGSKSLVVSGVDASLQPGGVPAYETKRGRVITS